MGEKQLQKKCLTMFKPIEVEERSLKVPITERILHIMQYPTAGLTR